MSKQLKGIGASEGIAVAKALVLNEQPLDLKATKITDLDQEISKFKAAVKQTVADLENLKAIAMKKLGPDKAAIFEAHQEIAQDPSISDEVIEEIKNNHLNAAYATFQVADKFKTMFEGMDDDYFKERASDIVDVSSRMIRHILDLKIVDLSTISEEVIIVAEDLTPSQTAQLDKKFVKGFATNVGGRTSHAAIMARSLEIPAVLGLKDLDEQVKNNEIIALNGTTGIVMLDLSEQDEQKIHKEAEE
jgi:phosphotransferase system enzyme I (PtsI)